MAVRGHSAGDKPKILRGLLRHASILRRRFCEPKLRIHAAGRLRIHSVTGIG